MARKTDDPVWTPPLRTVLLSGGNPQIPKGYGEAPIQAYIDATPVWKQAVVSRLDALITEVVPGVRKAVKWNTPLYGAPDRDDWFAGFHGFDRYVKVSFFNGADLKPPPPVASKQKNIRYLHIHETDAFDEASIGEWMRQAAARPGEKM